MELEYQHANAHYAESIYAAVFQRLHYALPVARTVIVAHYGHGAGVQAEYRHENEGLELEIDAEYAYSGRGEGYQYLVHAKGHYGAYHLKEDAWHAYLVYVGYTLLIRPEVPEAYFYQTGLAA